VATSYNGSISVWEVARRLEIGRVDHDGHVSMMAFSPDGKYLATAGISAVRVWLWRREDLVGELCGRLARNLTSEEWQQCLNDEPYRKICPDLP
jgi:WD40 repeat protein